MVYTSKLFRCIHHLKTDFINNMDHMRISGTKPSSVKRELRLNQYTLTLEASDHGYSTVKRFGNK